MLPNESFESVPVTRIDSSFVDGEHEIVAVGIPACVGAFEHGRIGIPGLP